MSKEIQRYKGLSIITFCRQRWFSSSSAALQSSSAKGAVIRPAPSTRKSLQGLILPRFSMPVLEGAGASGSQ
ncbi:hypothetical protein RGR602_CH02156 [Rhizobium gallicum bv. gallicum R602sp]|uniref:Uncharacterized protein n=1 Tax=Rhizobium gallicum bv. gallicum R602sp TaxID=1041138 RepID=A0A0B4X0P9_9HYPH|nr:hypothetical protein RGR602_CH02156 [Rhizobium gallicum bv. gallicum R602sp]